MSLLAYVAIDPSQFPEAVRADLIQSLRSRTLNHKFHYDSLKQTRKWLALHRAYSPSRTDPDCAATYRDAFASAARRIPQGDVHLVGLGCGGGQKDTALLGLLSTSTRRVFYSPCDVSVAMVLVARQAAAEVVGESNCSPFVLDLATSQDLSATVALLDRRCNESQVTQRPVARLFTFFGMLPNFEPEAILPKLSALIEPQDLLILSANLAPGDDYSKGVGRVLPLYDNDLTCDWLMTFLLDLGVEKTDGDLSFSIEDQPTPVHLKRIVARFYFTRDRAIEVDSERFDFRSGESIQVFFSYRHTPELVRSMLQQAGFEVWDQWVTRSQEEGVFLVRKI